MKINKNIFGALLLIVVVACSSPNFKDLATKKLNQFLAAHSEISATYFVTKGDEVIIEGAQGFFDKEKKISLVKNQIMPIASGTKQMTAAMILRLQERGILSIQDSLAKFLPSDSGWWPENKTPEWAYKVSVHTLLNHTSGIAEYIPALKFDIKLGHDKIKHLITAYAANTPLLDEPGASYNYSNTGYFFLGLIIEKLTNQDLATVYKTEFFDPLDMKDTHMVSFDEAIQFQDDQLKNYPRRYFGIPTGFEPKYMPAKVDFYLVPFSDGGVVSTSSDLIKWNKSFHNGKIVSEYSYKLMTTPYNDTHDLLAKDVKTGYGIYIHKLPSGQIVYYHSGRAVGIRSEHGYIPASDLYFAILSNVMVYETEEMQGKVDYTNIANQFDIEFLRSEICDLTNINSESAR